MHTKPRAGTRAAVIHALATATRYRTGTTVQTNDLRLDARLLPRTGYTEFDRVVSDATDDVVRSTVVDLALDGLVDLYVLLDGNATLTKAGVSEAISVRPTFESRNLTVEWLDRFLTRDQYDRLVRHVAYKAKHSRDNSEIREFVHEYIARVSARDGLRDRIVLGDDPSPSAIRSWVWKQTLSTFRDEGTDAQTRTVKGARTDRDLKGDTPRDAFAVSGDGPTTVVYQSTDDESTAGTPLVDVVDVTPSFTDVFLHREALNHGMARLEEAVRCAKPAAADRYARVLGLLAKGLTPAEVAAEEGVSHARAATLIAEVRAAGRRRAKIDRVRVAVIRYVDAEPMSTMSDLMAELDVDAPSVRDAVSELLADGFLHFGRNGSLAVTDLGSSTL